jgi:hypothetical protein
MNRWKKGLDLPEGWQSVVRDLEAEAGGFERVVTGPEIVRVLKQIKTGDIAAKAYIDKLAAELKMEVKPAEVAFGDSLDEKFFEKDRSVRWGGKSVPILTHESGHGVMSIAGLSKDYNITKSADRFYQAYKDKILELVKERVSPEDFLKIGKEFAKKNIGRGFGNSIESHSKFSRDFWKDVFGKPMVDSDILVGKRELFSHYSLSDANEFWADAITARVYHIPTGLEDLVDEAIRMAGGTPPQFEQKVTIVSKAAW